MAMALKSRQTNKMQIPYVQKSQLSTIPPVVFFPPWTNGCNLLKQVFIHLALSNTSIIKQAITGVWQTQTLYLSSTFPRVYSTLWVVRKFESPPNHNWTSLDPHQDKFFTFSTADKADLSTRRLIAEQRERSLKMGPQLTHRSDRRLFSISSWRVSYVRTQEYDGLLEYWWPGKEKDNLKSNA